VLENKKEGGLIIIKFLKVLCKPLFYQKKGDHSGPLGS